MKSTPEMIASRIYAHITDGEYSKALALGNRHRLDAKFAKSMLFWLSYAFAHMMSGTNIAKQTATPVYLCRRYARRDPAYSVELESNYWYTYHTLARQKKNFKAAIKMLELTRSLNPRNRPEMAEKQINQCKQELAKKKQGAKPRQK